MFSTLEIVLSLAQNEGFCPAEELFDHDHPIQWHLESALLVGVVLKILGINHRGTDAGVCEKLF